MKKLLSVFFRVGMSLALLVFLFYYVDTKSLLKTLKEADIKMVLLACIVGFSPLVLSLFRWQIFLKALGLNLALKRVLVSFSGGVFFNLLLPSAIGGDFVRTLDLAVYTKKAQDVLASVFLDRLSGYIGLVILAILAIFFSFRYGQERSVLLPLLVVSGILIAVLLVLFNDFLYRSVNRFFKFRLFGKVGEAIKNLHEQLHHFKTHKRAIITSVIISFLIQAIFPLTYYIIALSLGIKAHILYFFIFLPIVGAITLLPISLGGLGLREAAIVYFFSQIGMSKDAAFAMSLVSFSFLLLYGAIGGIVYVTSVHYRRLQSHQSSALPAASP